MPNEQQGVNALDVEAIRKGIELQFGRRSTVPEPAPQQKVNAAAAVDWGAVRKSIEQQFGATP